MSARWLAVSSAMASAWVGKPKPTIVGLGLLFRARGTLVPPAATAGTSRS